MAKNTKIKERGTNITLYPETSTEQVYSPDGRNLKAILPDLQEQIDGKQNELTTTEDLHISDSNLLSLTDMAKKRLFIDMWNAVCDKWGRFNEETGYFELNGLTDITYEQAQNIYILGNRICIPEPYINSSCLPIRTNLPPYDATRSHLNSFIFNGCTAEVINLDNGFGIRMCNTYATVGNCGYLERIIGKLDVSQAGNLRNNSPILRCPRLREVYLRHLTHGFYLGECQSINYESIKYMIDNANISDDNQVVLHPDVYAKLTGDTTNAAAAALTPEELAEWTALVPLAAEKQITFVTA